MHRRCVPWQSEHKLLSQLLIEMLHTGSNVALRETGHTEQEESPRFRKRIINIGNKVRDKLILYVNQLRAAYRAKETNIVVKEEESLYLYHSIWFL